MEETWMSVKGARRECDCDERQVVVASLAFRNARVAEWQTQGT